MREVCRIEGVVKMQSTKESNSKTIIARQRDELRGRPLVDSTNEHGGELLCDEAGGKQFVLLARHKNYCR